MKKSLKYIRFASYSRKLLQKRIVLNNCEKNHLKINYEKFHIYAEKDHIYFYKNSTNQTFTFISRKVVYLKNFSNIKYSKHPLETKFALPLNVPYHGQTIKLAVGAMTEVLHT